MVAFEYYNHLGFHNPYYTKNEDGSFFITRDNKDAISQIQKPQLDLAAIIEVLSLGYCLGDRTLVQDVYRTPWMAKPDENNSSWEYFSIPQREEKQLEFDTIVDIFYNLLREELIDYISNSVNIGILLTGGMDSRILAGVLYNLLQEDEFKQKKVFTFTWGLPTSRDVVYAKRIADLFGWEWEHLIVDVDQMNINLDLTLIEGCEFTPVHLHAMSQVSNKLDLDCVLAGSFGDSIGRGEYSGMKVKNLSSLNTQIKNVFSLLSNNAYSSLLSNINEDLNTYHLRFPQRLNYQLFEQDQQLHYMRRMLNPCMNVIDKNIPLHQLFTSPSVFNFIWSLDPSLRTDNIYSMLLKKYSSKLLEIPWARTGLIYPTTIGKGDGFLKKHHNYSKMIRENFLKYTEEAIVTYELEEFNIFNIQIIKDLIKHVKNRYIKNSVYYEERLLWIACLAKYLRVNNISNDLDVKNGLQGRLVANSEYLKKYVGRLVKN